MEKEFKDKGVELAKNVRIQVSAYLDLSVPMVQYEIMTFEKLDSIIRQNPRVIVIYYQDNIAIMHKIYQALIISLGVIDFKVEEINVQFGNYLCSYII